VTFRLSKSAQDSLHVISNFLHVWLADDGVVRSPHGDHFKVLGNLRSSFLHFQQVIERLGLRRGGAPRLARLFDSLHLELQVYGRNNDLGYNAAGQNPLECRDTLAWLNSLTQGFVRETRRR
jgi:hypothetical protein